MRDTEPAAENDKPPVDRHVGRRARSEKAILAAANELIAEAGGRTPTLEGDAARGGGDKDGLALAVLVDRTARFSAPPDRGDTRTELLTFLKTAKRVIRPGGVAQGLASEIATKPHLGRIYRERVVDV